MQTDRIVLDTNVFISGLLSSASPPARVLDLAVRHGQLLATVDTQQELVRTMLSTRFDRDVSRARREALLVRLAPLVELVASTQVVRACRDPKDDKFLEAAVNGRADVLITGDKDLLVLDPFAGIPIVTLAQYLERVEQEP